MTDLTDRMREDRLIEILMSYTFELEEQESINKMIDNNATIKDYVIALADGLRYGNWPWTNYTTNQKFKV